jgi:hypothetical protein
VSATKVPVPVTKTTRLTPAVKPAVEGTVTVQTVVPGMLYVPEIGKLSTIDVLNVVDVDGDTTTPLRRVR